MKILVERDEFTDKSTTSVLYINGIKTMYVLEDVDRKLESGGKKIYGKTCIPRGTYEVVIDYSPKYRKPMPHVLNVPQFEGVRIHPGNYNEDTEGCLLVGTTRGDDYVGNSRLAFAELMANLETAIADGEKIELTVT